MGPEEAIDLVLTLPPGSLYRAALDRHAALDDRTELAAQAVESLAAIGHLAFGSAAYNDARSQLRLPRPWDAADREEKRAKAHAAVERLNGTKWRDVEPDG